MKRLNNTQKQGIALVLVGTAIAVLSIRPPKWLVRAYLTFEQAVAACVGVLLAVAGAAALLGLDASARKQADAPVYTIHFDDEGNAQDETKQ